MKIMLSNCDGRSTVIETSELNARYDVGKAAADNGYKDYVVERVNEAVVR